MVNVANVKNVAVSMSFAPIVMRTARQWCRKVSTIGTRASWCSAFTFTKEGISPTLLRIHSPTTIRTTENRKGIRHPMVRKCRHQRLLPPYAVADVAEDDAADGAHDESQCERGK